MLVAKAFDLPGFALALAVFLVRTVDLAFGPEAYRWLWQLSLGLAWVFVWGSFALPVVSGARYVTVSFAFAAFLSAVAILASGRLPFSFFPPLAADQVVAKLRWNNRV